MLWFSNQWNFKLQSTINITKISSYMSVQTPLIIPVLKLRVVYEIQIRNKFCRVKYRRENCCVKICSLIQLINPEEQVQCFYSIL